MTSYMYNPSKKVTELLSQYLEFDPAQLELGIWSGHLTLTDVSLRKEAAYRILNPQAATAGGGGGGASGGTQTSSGGAQQQQQQQQQGPHARRRRRRRRSRGPREHDLPDFISDSYTKPPLRFELLSGTIGSLSLTIPWKRLVWTQGDVQLHMRNVVLVVTTAPAHHHNHGDLPKTTSGALNRNNFFEPLGEEAEEDEDDSAGFCSDSEADEKEIQEDMPSAPLLSSAEREIKQKRIREAERRHLQGKVLGPWLDAARKLDAEMAAKKQAAIDAMLLGTSKDGDRRTHSGAKGGSWERWLNSATNDFFWRFWAGLQTNIENLKIVFVQDGVEVGLMVPSLHVSAGKQGNPLSQPMPRHRSQVGIPSIASMPSSRKNSNAQANHDDASRGTGSGNASYMAYDNVIYEGEFEDGEHVDKHIHFVGIGVFVRKATPSTAPVMAYPSGANPSSTFVDGRPANPYGTPGATRGPTATPPIANFQPAMFDDVSTKEYFVRPVDVDFSFSLFYPYPPEKRKKRAAPKPSLSHNSASPDAPVPGRSKDGTPSDDANSTIGSSKRRRGKRDKKPLAPPAAIVGHPVITNSNESTTAMTEPTSVAPSFNIHGLLPQTPVGMSSDPATSHSPQAVADNRSQIPLLSAMPAHVRRMTTVGATPLHSTPLISAPPERVRRSTTLLRTPSAGRVLGAAAPLAAPGGRHLRHHTADYLPLFQPDDVGGAFAAATADRQLDIKTPQLDGSLSIGAVQMVCSTRHYELIRTFLAAGEKMRNGRPSKTIQSVLSQGLALRRSLTVLASTDVVKASVAKDLRSAMDMTTPKSLGMVEEGDRISTKVRLELHNARTERSSVVRSWWRYILGVIVWEIRQRRKLRKAFQEKFLSFSWGLQKHLRKEYVQLYIATHFAGPGGGSVDIRAKQDEILRFEDELSVEQILLYRSIARAVHVRGGTKMPNSILDVHEKQRHQQLNSRASGVDGAEWDPLGEAQRGTNILESDEIEPPIEEESTYLAIIEARCEHARRRRMSPDGEGLIPYEPFLSWSKFGTSEGASTDQEDASRGIAMDSRSVVSHRTTRSRQSMAATLLETLSIKGDISEKSLLVSFALNIVKLELMIVEEEFYNGVAESRHPGSSVASAGQEEESTEVSVLTDDQRFFLNEVDVISQNGDVESLMADPIMSSTDYLLFRMPEKILLRLVVAPLTGSALGRSGGSQNLNLTVGRISASGANGSKLIQMGESEADSPTFIETTGTGVHQPASSSGTSRAALSLSLVTQSDDNAVQCDGSIVRGCVDIVTLEKLVAFSRHGSAVFPSQIMPRSPREEVRVYVLRQNSRATFSALNCSIRLHGCELTLPVGLRSPAPEDLTRSSLSNGFDPCCTGGGMIRCSMVELYSGTAVEALCDSMSGWHQPDVLVGTKERRSSLVERTQAVKTRRLKMLDISDMIASRGSVLSNHWVVTATGFDLVTSDEGFDQPDVSISLLENAIDIEMLWIANSDSVLDFNRSRNEMVVEMSPVHLVLSERKVDLLSQVLPRNSTLQAGHEQSTAREGLLETLAPRLDVLSGLMLLSLDFSMSSLRVSFLVENRESAPRQAEEQHELVEESLSGFLKVVSAFDLSFPHEEALSMAMQICIDRLVGVGFLLEQAWEATNTVLLNFLEDVAEFRKEDDESESEHDFPSSASLRMAREKSVQRTLVSFVENLKNTCQSADHDPNDIIVDLPDGMLFSTVQLFYDRYIEVVVPTAFVATGSGMHLMRITSPAKSQGEADTVRTRSEHSEQVQSGNGLKTRTAGPHSGASFRRFVLDAQHSFSKGGLPLAALGSDSDGTDEQERRSREHLNDVEFGDVEVLFARVLYSQAVSAVERILAPLRYPQRDFSKGSVGSGTSSLMMERSLLVAFYTSSLLCVSDGLAPFARLVVQNIVIRNDALAGPSSWSYRAAAQCLDLHNLTSDGELYPNPITRLPGQSDAAVKLRFTSVENSSNLGIDLYGIRIVLLRQFLNEILQYFVSGRYGLSLFMKEWKGSEKGDSTKTSSFGFQLNIMESSLVLPRSCTQSELVAIELERATIYSTSSPSTFSMPTKYDSLAVGGNRHTDNSIGTSELDFHDCVDALEDISDHRSTHESSAISRTIIELSRFRMFTCLHRTGQTPLADSPAFRFFYSINGRAAPNKLVYAPLPVDLEADQSQDFLERTGRLWHEITSDAASIDIVVDYAPHLRLLVADPLEGIHSSLNLDLQLPQFCMILSIWFSNMQELPMMFPYTAEQLQSGAQSSSYGAKIPDYGSMEFKRWLMEEARLTSEIAITCDSLTLRCRLEEGLGHGDTNAEGENAVVISLSKPTVHITNDTRGLTRIGSGALKATLHDESKIFDEVLLVESRSETAHSWADLSFGLDRSYLSLNGELDLPFQLSVFMTSGWALYQLGLNDPQMKLSDFSAVFKFLSFVSAYFSDPSYGNPSFEAAERVKKIKFELARNSGGILAGTSSTPFSGVDFRLWACRPCMLVPCNPSDRSTPVVRLECESGLWYRYTSMGSFISQECISKGLRLLFDGNGMPGCGRDDASGKLLVANLSLGLRLDSNSETSHTDVSVVIPFADKDSCTLASARIDASPCRLSAPSICVPYAQHDRFLGPMVCEITCIIDVLPATWTALLALFGGSSHDADDGACESDVVEDKNELDSESVSSKSDEATFSLVARLSDFRFFALDPVLGAHLPVGVLSLSSLTITASQFDGDGGSDDESEGDLQVVVEGIIWADYFKLGLTRSWEPLLEVYGFVILVEKSRSRGSGMSVSSDSPFHLNISGALLVILDEVVDVFRRLIHDTFGSNAAKSNPLPEVRTSPADGNQITARETWMNQCVVHALPRPLEPGDRVAFSIRNMTGQKIRLYRSEALHENPDVQSAVVTYLSHLQAVQLYFQPSISIVENLKAVEVEYPGFHDDNGGKRNQVPHHIVDIQLPGFRWLRGIRVDTFGRSFASISPRSFNVSWKAKEDWRLDNVMKLLVEVGLENGGRQVTIRSLFTVVNKTTYDLCLLAHPDPSYRPKDLDGTEAYAGTDRQGEENDKFSVIDPGGSYQVPTLLIESSLRQPGSHLGSIWIRPRLDFDSTNEIEGFHQENADGGSELSVEFSSRPVQLAKLVTESAMFFSSGRGQDIASESAKSGLQVSCPVVRESGDRLAPFCYVVEIGRSPLVKGHLSGFPKKRSTVHGPVSYTLSVHAPLVIINFLPERGRFELMHAVRRTVLWYADLEPGQQASVYSVGLDAPLLLLLNLGYCRTPVGEGALVHHGVDPPPGARDNLGGFKSIGKAGKAVTKQLGKKLTSMGESPDKRGHNLVALARNPQLIGRRTLKRDEGARHMDAKGDLGLNTGVTGIDEVDGKMYRIDTTIFFPHDVASETVLVDGLGQRLTLNIENIRGGGGQRRISVFCPFWIVNTTEHALRYKQENSKNFVCGTVLSPNKDGSTPLSGGRSLAKYKEFRNSNDESGDLSRVKDTGTIFSGTPGALATSSGRCDLPPRRVAELIDKNLGLATLAQLGFMFNFHDGVVANASQRLCVQLGDGTGSTRYVSDWSRGINVDSVGFTQMIGIHCKDGRALEIIVVVSVAPGPLASYTKIVRFLPRYVIANMLPYPVRLWQDSSVFRPLDMDHKGPTGQGEQKWRYDRDRGRRSQMKVNQYEALWGRETALSERDEGRMTADTTAHRSAQYITTVASTEMVPFNLPDPRGDRQLRVGLGAPWNLTSSFSADVPGEHILKLSRAVDLKILPHIQTRTSPEYIVKISPSTSGFTGELGLWFETEWGSNRSLIVKAVKKNSFAFNETDVHVGDELLAIDSEPVSRMTFSEALGNLRVRLNEITARIQKDPRRVARRASLRAVLSRSSSEAPEGQMPDVDPLTLTFRTVEERLRRVRLKAAKTESGQKFRRSNIYPRSPTLRENTAEGTAEGFADLSGGYLRVEMRTLQHSLYLILRDDVAVPFQIQNLTFNSTIYFRQRACEGHPWKFLKPGQTDSYAWEEPMKPKRLTLRVASESTFNFVNEANPDIWDDDSSGGQHHLIQSRRASQVRKIQDEEDAVFSPSISVRLEEIGFREYLAWTTHSSGLQSASKRYLEFEVDVIGSTRVLMVRDVSNESGEEHIVRHLDSLASKAAEEIRRLNELTALNGMIAQANSRQSNGKAGDGRSVYAIVEDAKRLMEDHFQVGCISDRHQVVVEVLEAIGLSSDAFVDFCNPYAEISLKSSAGGTRTLFQKACVMRTYYVRKTANPSWKGQSFVFCIPLEAVSNPRGYTIKISLRNYRVFGYHQHLGTAKVDLHAVRDQEPVEGWFSLAGRTGRQELENQLSHWGRGSVKLRVQWIYSIPALLQYFVRLSQDRVLALQESREGMAEQLKNKRAADEKRKEAVDGFKAVRVQDIISLSKERRKSAPGLSGRAKTEIEGVVKKRVDFFRQGIGSRRRQQVVFHATNDELSDSSSREKDALSNLRAVEPIGNRKIDVFNNLEDRITAQRLAFKKILSTRFAADRDSSLVAKDGFAGECSVLSFKSWISAQTLFNDHDLQVKVAGQRITTNFRQGEAAAKVEVTQNLHLVAAKLRLPAGAPSSFTSHLAQHACEFHQSRSTFEQFARRSLETILHPGGWLTIRPITALNLQDTYTGMFVKLRYGSVTLTSETVDARVNPSWYEPHRLSDSDDGSVSIHQRDVNPNDLHIHVAPQKTNGTIRISVMGERSHQQLTAKVELGVLHLPLGATITACLSTSDDGESDADAYSHMYVRWFPLKNPRDAVPVEGDGGVSFRPPDTERISDHLFQEYFAPCIQMALIWVPDADESHEIGRQDFNEGANEPAQPRPSILSSYFIADVGKISAALIDSQRAFEIVSVMLFDMDLRYWVTRAKTRMGVSIGWIQIDHQTEGAREPIILAPTPTDYLVPVLQTLAVQDNIRSKMDILSFDFIDISTAEFDVTIEESFLLDLFRFFHSVSLRKGVRVRASLISEGVSNNHVSNTDTTFTAASNEIEEPTLASIMADGFHFENQKSNKVYIEQLFLGVVRMNLSYLKGKRSPWELTSQGSWVDKRIEGGVQALQRIAITSGERLLDTLSMHQKSDVFQGWSQHTSEEDRQAEDGGKGWQNLQSLFANLFPNVSDAPVRLPGKALNHVFERPSEILESIRKYYVNETLKQIYKIIGSLDFVGNPTMLFTSFFSGVRDLVLVPSVAFLKSPTDPSLVGIGVATGTLSLVSHSVSGFFGFCAKVSAAAGQAVAALSLDGDYRDWHRDKIVIEATNLNRQWKRRGLQSVKAMIAKPVADILIGVGGGVSGVFISPFKAYQKKGGAGLPRGITVGIVGVVARPVVGVLDAFAHFTASIHDIAKSVNVLERRLQPALKLRLPYVFGPFDILMPFDAVTARASYLLLMYPMHKGRINSATPGKETLVHAEVLPNIGTDTYAVATSARVVLIRIKKDPAGTLTPTLCWEVDLRGEAVVSSRVADHGHNGVAMTITVAKAADLEEDVPTTGLDARGENQGQAEGKRNSEHQGHSGENADGGADRDEVVADIESTTPSSRAIGLAAPEDSISPVAAGEEFNHGTGRGNQGELLEWFTVLAEYQYRRQLARLHNAICCIVGDFDGIMRDPSLGIPSIGEGYTTFGILDFEVHRGDNDAIVSKDRRVLEKLEGLQWLSDDTIRSLFGKPGSEQAMLLKELQIGRALEDEIAQSRTEGGPEWLILARAQAVFTKDDQKNLHIDTEDVTHEAIQTPSASVALAVTNKKRRHRWANQFSLPSIPDEDDGDPDSRENERSRFRSAAGNSIYESAVQANEEFGLSFNDVVDSSIRSMSSAAESLGFGTAVEKEENEGAGTETPDAPLASRDVLAMPNVQVSSLVNPSVQTAEGPNAARAGQEAAGWASTTTTREIQEVRTQVYFPAPGSAGESQGQRNERLDRMERLMERLLIFSTEQALQPRPQLGYPGQVPGAYMIGDWNGALSAVPKLADSLPAPANVEASLSSSDAASIAALRRELADLRSEMQTHALETMSSQEIEDLRKEVAELRVLIIKPGSAEAAFKSDPNSF